MKNQSKGELISTLKWNPLCKKLNVTWWWGQTTTTKKNVGTYLSLTELKNRTVNYGPRFSLWFMAQGEIEGEKMVRNLQYRPRSEGRKIFFTYLYLELERAETKL